MYLGYMNSWCVSGTPAEYHTHLEKCGNDDGDYPMTVKTVGRCLTEWECHECGIIFRVDSSD